MKEFFAAFSAVMLYVLTSGWFWISVLALAVLYLLVLWYRHRKILALERLEYSRSFSSDGVFAGDVLEFCESLRNPTFFPLFAVRMEFFVPGGFVVDHVYCKEYTKIASVFFIPPRATVTKTHTVCAQCRGHFHMETATVRYRSNEILFSDPFDLYVYPNYASVKAEVPPDLYHAGQSLAQSRMVEDPFFLAGIRPYVPGDPMRAVNFKASVRSFSGGMRCLMTNSYDSSRNYDAMIFLDLYAHVEGDNIDKQKQRLEMGLCYATYLLHEIVQHGGAVGFTSNCAEEEKPYTRIPCGRGNLHAEHILKCFAGIHSFAKRDYSIVSLLDAYAGDPMGGVDLYLITANVDDATAMTLRRLENMGRNVCVIPLRGEAAVE